jgi:hypothetical protein
VDTLIVVVDTLIVVVDTLIVVVDTLIVVNKEFVVVNKEFVVANKELSVVYSEYRQHKVVLSIVDRVQMVVVVTGYSQELFVGDRKNEHIYKQLKTQHLHLYQQ